MLSNCPACNTPQIVQSFSKSIDIFECDRSSKPEEAKLCKNIEVDSLLHQVPVADTNAMSLSSIAALSTIGFPDTSTYRLLAVLTLLIVSLRISARVSALSLDLFDLLEHHWDQVMGICLAEF